MNNTPRTLEELAIEKAKIKDEELKAKAVAKAAKEAERQRVADEKKKAADLKAEDKKKKDKEKEELTAEEKYSHFQKALDIYEKYQPCFFRDGQSKYFHSLTTSKRNLKSDKEEYCTEIKWYPPSSLYPNWIELQHPFAQSMFRKMIEGEKISVYIPDADDTAVFQFPPRVYEKLINTVDMVDDKTFNLLDLKGIMQPSYDTEQQQTCPIIIKALLFALSGCSIMWNDDEQRWVGSKQENLDWLEKWMYGVLHADIGNNMLSMPVIFGKGKVGKNALFDIIFSNVLGAELRFTGMWETIDSSFNGFKLNKTFIYGDEIPERSEWNKIKNFTGSIKDYIKLKYGVEMEVDNCISYAWGSNQDQFPLPFEDGPQMMRVSPIKVGASTFAENAVKMLDKAHGENYCRKLLKAEGINSDDMSDFMVGDTVLRKVLTRDWQGREASQQMLNYLDQKFKGPRYSLEPLRGQDWEDIAEYKRDAIKCTADHIIANSPDIITVHEVHEIYKVIQSERNAVSSKQLKSCTESIKSYLLDEGYCYKVNARIANGAQCNIFHRGALEHGKISSHKEEFERYIVEQQQYGKSVRRLKAVGQQLRTVFSQTKTPPTPDAFIDGASGKALEAAMVRPRIDVESILNSVRSNKKD